MKTTGKLTPCLKGTRSCSAAMDELDQLTHVLGNLNAGRRLGDSSSHPSSLPAPVGTEHPGREDNMALRRRSAPCVTPGLLEWKVHTVPAPDFDWLDDDEGKEEYERQEE
ncbi:hypothetical protein T484DRAFT_1890089, partial [Baffinella frigidus]